jgi:hypothetical protein
MKTRVVEVSEGEDMGPVDWEHPTAKDMPPIWREAAEHPEDFLLDNGGLHLKTIYRICMYDGWPYWKPTPAIQYQGPLGPEWTFFNSYAIRPTSIKRKGQR